MTNTAHPGIAERLALQRDELPGADFEDVQERSRRLAPHRNDPLAARRWSQFSWHVPTRVAVIAAAIFVVGVGSATALAMRVLAQSPVAQGFSALTNPALPEVTASTPGVAPNLEMRLTEELGPDYAVRQVGDGMFLGQEDGNLCEVVANGSGQCTDHLDGNVWFLGDMFRSSDAETAPFSVHLYGFARDNVAAVRITVAGGSVTSVPVQNNAFQTTLSNTSFGDITKVEVITTSGETTSIDPRRYFPVTTPSGPEKGS